MRKERKVSKRRDKKGRILRSGESQRADGRYAYVYTDHYGKRRFIYSWKLEPTDPLPAGRRKCVSLREKEQELMKDLLNGIIACGGDITVLTLVQKYILQKAGVRHTTKAGYKTVVNILKKDDFGAMRIDKVKLSDAKAWLIQLQANGRGYSSIHSIRGVLRPAF